MTDNRAGVWAAAPVGNECHKGVPVGQGACCQIKSQHSSGLAGERRASSTIHAGIQGDLLPSVAEIWGG